MISLQFWSTVLIEDCLFHCIIIFCFGYVFNCFIRYHILNFYSKLFFWVLFLDWFLIGLKEYKKKMNQSNQVVGIIMEEQIFRPFNLGKNNDFWTSL
jgi:hypothetical protein